KRFLTVRQFVDEVLRVGHGEVIELKKTAPEGHANRPKGELVQTLMGVRKGGGMAAPTQGAMHAVQQPAAPVVAQARPGTNPAGNSAGNPMAKTMMGVPSMGMQPGAQPGGIHMLTSPAGPVGMTPLTPVQGVPPQDRSPWAAPGTVPAGSGA